MFFDLKRNGLDSIRVCFEKIEKIDELAVGKEYNIKDALFYLIQANEVLFKLLLKEQQEYLIFTDIRGYIEAKKKLEKHVESDKTVFDINPKLNTVGLNEAINRLQFLCDTVISEDFKTLLEEINKERNKLMHFEIFLDDNEVKSLIVKIKLCHNLTIEFFKNKIEQFEDEIKYKRFELTTVEYEGIMEESLRVRELLELQAIHDDMGLLEQSEDGNYNYD